MTISEVTDGMICEYLHIDPEEVDELILKSAKDAALQYMISRTGMQPSDMDNYPDMTVAFLVMVQDLYENRSYIQDSGKGIHVNRSVESILGLHERNLL